MQERDYKWFLDNYSQISDSYYNCYVVIKDETILGSYHSYAEAVRETAKSEPIGSFIVQLCNGNETAYTNFISSVNLAVT